MISVKTSHFYLQVIKELHYPFGNVYVFNGFLVSEINEGVIFSWDEHGKRVAEDVSCYLGTLGDNLIYISNRIHSYSVVASDWKKYYQNYKNLRGYYVVEEKKQGALNSLVESLFFNGNIKRFNSLEEAFNFTQFSLLNQLGA
ncbi:MAG: hypothetical protein HKO92_06640 [Flavobacteriaceae bacterium]|nr:hypothetical protein [Flavobacteriaceae bacterium]